MQEDENTDLTMLIAYLANIMTGLVFAYNLGVYYFGDYQHDGYRYFLVLFPFIICCVFLISKSIKQNAYWRLIILSLSALLQILVINFRGQLLPLFGLCVCAVTILCLFILQKMEGKKQHIM